MGICDGSGISWTTCKQSAPRSREITAPTPHRSIFTGQMLFLTPSQQCQSTEERLWKETFYDELDVSLTVCVVMSSLWEAVRVYQLLLTASLQCSIVSMPMRSRSFAADDILCTALSSRSESFRHWVHCHRQYFLEWNSFLCSCIMFVVTLLY